MEAFYLFQPSRSLKLFVIVLSLVVFTTNCLFAYAPETNLARRKAGFWKERHRSSQLAALPGSGMAEHLPKLPSLSNSRPPLFPSQISKNKVSKWLKGQQNEPLKEFLAALPAQYGTIRGITNTEGGGSNRIILHIQDVHMNQEAQNNIGATIQELMNNDKIGLVALEGAFGFMDLNSFREFPHQGTVQKVADYLLQNNKISGPIHAGYVSPTNIPPFVGVDDPHHYEENVRAVKDSYPLRGRTKKAVLELELELELEKSQTFSKELLLFDRKVIPYRKNQIEMGEFVEILSSYSVDHPLMVSTFLEALGLERSINFKKVEIERSHLLSQLLKRLDKNETTDLINASLAFRLGQLNPAAFYQYLNNRCNQNGIPLKQYKEMNRYLQYVLLSDSIDASVLIRDIRELEESIYAKLAKRKEEKDLIQASRYLYLTKKLVDFALTAEEWEEYKKVRSPESVVRDLKMNNYHAPRTADHGLLQSFEFFYRHAEARDRAMAQNLINSINDEKADIAILVTGGFHSEGIQTHLKGEDVTVVSWVPKITQVKTETGPAYLSVFTQEKTPLEKLFEGEKLFLATPQLTPGDQKIHDLHLIGQSVPDHLSIERGKKIMNSKPEWSQVQLQPEEDGSLSLSGVVEDSVGRPTLFSLVYDNWEISRKSQSREVDWASIGKWALAASLLIFLTGTLANVNAVIPSNSPSSFALISLFPNFLGDEKRTRLGHYLTLLSIPALLGAEWAQVVSQIDLVILFILLILIIPVLVMLVFYIVFPDEIDPFLDTLEFQLRPFIRWYIKSAIFSLPWVLMILLFFVPLLAADSAIPLGIEGINRLGLVATMNAFIIFLNSQFRHRRSYSLRTLFVLVTVFALFLFGFGPLWGIGTFLMAFILAGFFRWVSPYWSSFISPAISRLILVVSMCLSLGLSYAASIKVSEGAQLWISWGRFSKAERKIEQIPMLTIKTEMREKLATEVQKAHPTLSKRIVRIGNEILDAIQSDEWNAQLNTQEERVFNRKVITLLNQYVIGGKVRVINKTLDEAPSFAWFDGESSSFNVLRAFGEFSDEEMEGILFHETIHAHPLHRARQQARMRMGSTFEELLQDMAMTHRNEVEASDWELRYRSYQARQKGISPHKFMKALADQSPLPEAKEKYEVMAQLLENQTLQDEWQLAIFYRQFWNRAARANGSDHRMTPPEYMRDFINKARENGHNLNDAEQIDHWVLSWLTDPAYYNPVKLQPKGGTGNRTQWMIALAALFGLAGYGGWRRYQRKPLIPFQFRRNREKNRSNEAGAMGFWREFGVRSRGLAGVLDTVLVDSLFLSFLAWSLKAGPPAGSLGFVVSLILLSFLHIFLLTVFLYLGHYGSGVIDEDGSVKNPKDSTERKAMAREATRTAFLSFVAVPFFLIAFYLNNSWFWPFVFAGMAVASILHFLANGVVLWGQISTFDIGRWVRGFYHLNVESRDLISSPFALADEPARLPQLKDLEPSDRYPDVILSPMKLEIIRNLIESTNPVPFRRYPIDHKDLRDRITSSVPFLYKNDRVVVDMLVGLLFASSYSEESKEMALNIIDNARYQGGIRIRVSDLPVQSAWYPATKESFVKRHTRKRWRFIQKPYNEESTETSVPVNKPTGGPSPVVIDEGEDLKLTDIVGKLNRIVSDFVIRRRDFNAIMAWIFGLSPLVNTYQTLQQGIPTDPNERIFEMADRFHSESPPRVSGLIRRIEDINEIGDELRHPVPFIGRRMEILEEAIKSDQKELQDYYDQIRELSNLLSDPEMDPDPLIRIQHDRALRDLQWHQRFDDYDNDDWRDSESRFRQWEVILGIGRDRSGWSMEDKRILVRIVLARRLEELIEWSRTLPKLQRAAQQVQSAYSRLKRSEQIAEIARRTSTAIDEIEEIISPDGGLHSNDDFGPTVVISNRYCQALNQAEKNLLKKVDDGEIRRAGRFHDPKNMVHFYRSFMLAERLAFHEMSHRPLRRDRNRRLREVEMKRKIIEEE
ncbi:hypothetical protein BVX98_04950, partial [bacterium F11]